MGFSSVVCKCCRKSILAPPATNEINGWMSEATAVLPDGTIHQGWYDGYSFIHTTAQGVRNMYGDDYKAEKVGYRLEYDFENGGVCTAAVYHTACWEVKGSPTKMPRTGGSKSAYDQGYFIDGKRYIKADPRLSDEERKNIEEDALIDFNLYSVISKLF